MLNKHPTLLQGACGAYPLLDIMIMTVFIFRIQKARLKALTKQLEDSKDLRKQLMDQVNDLQKQLKNERDDNKQLRKRYQPSHPDSFEYPLFSIFDTM